jgi:putative transposase
MRDESRSKRSRARQCDSFSAEQGFQTLPESGSQAYASSSLTTGFRGEHAFHHRGHEPAGAVVRDRRCLRERMLSVLEHYRAKYQMDCFGYVLMPDHLHAMFRQNEEGDLISRLMRGFKEYTSRHVFPEFGIPVAWRPNYDDVPIPGREAALTRLAYMLDNPVRAGIVESVGDYRWSSPRVECEIEKSVVTISPI